MFEEDFNLIGNIVTVYKVNVFVSLFAHINTENRKKTELVMSFPDSCGPQGQSFMITGSYF